MGNLMSILQNTAVNDGHNSNRMYNYKFPTSVSNNFNDNYYFGGFKCKRNNNDKLFFEDDEILKKMEGCVMPLPFPVLLPTSNVTPIGLSMFAPKNSFSVARSDDSDSIMLQFLFDTDCACTIDVYCFVVEKFINGKMSFVLSPNKGFKYSSVHEYGPGQLFQCELQLAHLTDTSIDVMIPLTVVLSSQRDDRLDFQQFVTNLSFEIKSNSQQISYVQITTQRLVYCGNCYLMQEMYGDDMSPEQELKQSRHSNLCIPDGKNTDGSQMNNANRPNEFLMQDCVVCMTAVRDTLVIPCRHLCLCGSCGERLLRQSPACPICRSTFRALLQLGNLEKYLCNSYQTVK